MAKDRFGVSHARLAEIIPFAAQLTLECIGNSDALYHNVEHTMLITLAGHDIFKGRALLTASTPIEYSNFIVACLAHDIGYVRGVVKGDGTDGLVVDAAGRKVTLPRGSSDAALAPYHVERSKLFVLDRLAEIEELDGARIAGAIEHTRFPFTSAPEDHAIDEWAALLRAADLIGQLGDPHFPFPRRTPRATRRRFRASSGKRVAGSIAPRRARGVRNGRRAVNSVQSGAESP